MLEDDVTATATAGYNDKKEWDIAECCYTLLLFDCWLTSVDRELILLTVDSIPSITIGDAWLEWKSLAKDNFKNQN